MIATIWNLIAGDLLPYIATGIAALVGAVGLYFKGRADAKAKADKRDMQEELQAHDRITKADTGADLDDAGRVARLREFADRHGKRK
jgi:hypothetical protein